MYTTTDAYLKRRKSTDVTSESTRAGQHEDRVDETENRQTSSVQEVHRPIGQYAKSEKPHGRDRMQRDTTE